MLIVERENDTMRSQNTELSNQCQHLLLENEDLKTTKKEVAQQAAKIEQRVQEELQRQSV